MLDWSKLGPANSPTPNTPDTTVPVAPATPGSLPSFTPSLGTPAATGPYQTGTYREASQAEVDAMDPGTRVARGIDHLGSALFGQDNGSFLGGIPGAGLLASGLGVAGQGAQRIGDLTVIKPIEAAATGLSHIPLGWAGADSAFDAYGNWAKQNDPTVYAQWQAVKAASDGDVLGGGNMKADFNIEIAQYLDDKQKDSTLGTTPLLAEGKDAVGSVGGALSNAIQSFLGVGSNTVQRGLAGSGILDTGAVTYDYVQKEMAAGRMTQAEATAYEHAHQDNLNRVDESAARMDAGMPVSDVEKQAVEAVRSGAWSMDHALDFLVTHGQGISSNPIVQAVGTVATDPLTLATLGAGSVASTAAEGARIAESGVDAATTYEKLAVNLAKVQQSQMGPAFRFMRGMIDPLSVYKPSTVANATTDLYNGVAATSYERAMGPITVKNVRSLAREFDIGPEIDSAIGQRARTYADQMIAMKAQKDLLNEGLGLDLMDPAASGAGIDDTVRTLAQNAARDSVTQLTDHISSIAKNTFTPEEDANLAGKMSVIFGKDVPYWTERLKGMSFNERSTLHDLVYGRAEVAFEQARGAVNAEDYKGTLPLRNMVLMSADTLDDQTAKSIIENIRAVLKSEDTPERIAAATDEWNGQARRYGQMSTLGYAPGGREQVNSLVDELEKELDRGAVTRRALDEEMSDPALKPIRDMLDRHSSEGPNAYASQGRVVSQGEQDALRARGQELLNVPVSKTPADLQTNVAKVADELHQRTALTEWGGATYSPRTGKFIEQTNQYMYHGTNARNEASIGAAGLNRGEFADLATATRNASGKKTLIYRAKEFDIPGIDKAPGWKQVSGKGVSADALQVSRDGGVTWESVGANATVPDGPWVSGVGKTTSISIADAQDPAKFKAALNQFVAENEAELQKPGMFVGTFRDEKMGTVQFDVSRATFNEHDTEAVQVAAGRTGGAYNTATGNGLFAPRTAEEAAAGPHPLWKVGFRPDEDVAWAIKHSPINGSPVIDRAPTISHVVDAVPGRQRFSDTTRNLMGQMIGVSKAERLNGPIDSIEAYVNTTRDVITGRRLVNNVERRFERSTFDAGIPKNISSEIMSRAKDVAGLDRTTLRGVNPDNIWKAIDDVIPRDLKLTSGAHAGQYLDKHIVMDHLLQASEGDLRIMGATSKLSQRVRNQLRAMGDGSNWTGQMTVTMYNKLRYSQPVFLIQRMTDAPYFSLLYGIAPVGKTLTGEANKAMRVIVDNMGRTGLARYFSMDMPEYATRANFTEGITSGLKDAGVKGSRLDAIKNAPDALIASNMVNMTHARIGDIVKGALNNLATAAEKADPAMQADMLKAGDVLNKSFADWRRVYSEQAGRALDDNEVGLRYVQDQLNAWRRHVVNTDGTIDMSKLIHEGERAMPSDIGQIGTIRPDALAQEMGYKDAVALRQDVVGHVEKNNGVYTLVKGQHDLPWLEEQLRERMGAHPDYTRRAMAYFNETWGDYWTRLSRGVDQGGLDISPHYAKEAQAVIAREAQSRGMDPWEYLSGVMATNAGPQSLDTAMGRLVGFLKTGKTKQPIEAWAEQFRNHLDVSAQQTLLKEFESEVNVEDVMGVPTPAPFRTTAKGNALMPGTYKPEAGHVYRIDTLDKMRGGFRKGEGVSTDANPIYASGRPGEGVFRAKLDDSQLAPGRNAATQPGGKDRLTKAAVPPDQIEMLNDKGEWVTLGPDPMDKVMGKDFPEVVRQRLISGQPHPNPEVESYIRAFSKWVGDNIGAEELGGRTRSDLRQLVTDIPHDNAVTFNRTHALITTLLKDKIEDAGSDVFRLAEMQTQRTVLERSLNHPLFGLYPASYMWGKVLPETVKFLAKNPYAATYVIADVQRAIATQREYDSDVDQKVGAVDRSAGAFLLDYLTPSLPWSDQSARMSPMVRDLFAGKDVGKIWDDELSTVSPQRWVQNIARAGAEVPGAVQSLTQPQNTPTGNALQSLAAGASPAPTGPTAPAEISGPTQASALGPILQDDLTRLQSILLSGAAAGK